MLSNSAETKLHMYKQDYLKSSTLENSFLSFSFAKAIVLIILNYVLFLLRETMDMWDKYMWVVCFY